jgi:type III secretion protein N (ATPase)
VTTPEHRAAARRVPELLAKYQEIELLVQIGEYREGSDALGDTALRAHAALTRFFEQDADTRVPLERTVADLQAVVEAL